jgi:Fe-S-cluster containining protein
LADSGLVVVDEWREVAQSRGGDGATAVRRACPALEFRDQRWRCSIENVKPAGCVAYPLTLVLREQSGAGAQWSISLELNGPTPRQSCPLDRALRRSPRLLQRFREDVQRRQGHRHGAFMLAAYNRKKQLEAATPMHGELR